jgi:splicing factor 3A subunit 1
MDSTEERALVGRREVLQDAQERAEWEKWESSRRKEEEDKAEAERIAFAEIDWQDFQVASTIEFTESDEAGLAELPPPMSLSEVENMTLAQKKMNSIFIDGKEGEEEENGHEEEEMEMDASDDEAEAVPTEKKTEDKVEVATLDANLPVKIRKDYVRSKKDKKGQAYTTFDGQQVPVEEFSKHVRYELLDPRWKEEKKQADLNRSAANLLPGGKSNICPSLSHAY